MSNQNLRDTFDGNGLDGQDCANGDFNNGAGKKFMKSNAVQQNPSKLVFLIVNRSKWQ